MNSVNFFLNKANLFISVLDIKKKKLLFHSRFSAKKRTYKYIIINRIGSLTINRDRAWHIKKKLNINLMKKAGRLLMGKRDFSTFRASSCNAKSAVKTIENISIIKSKSEIISIFKSRSFLQQQVRSMMGCIKYVGEEKWTIKKFKEIMLSKKRELCAPPAPAQGLYLYRVDY